MSGQHAKTTIPDLEGSEWVKYAECGKPWRDPEDWFPTTVILNHRNKAAIALCNVCPVQQQCLKAACKFRLAQTDLWGIWAGKPAGWFQDRQHVQRVLEMLG